MNAPVYLLLSREQLLALGVSDVAINNLMFANTAQAIALNPTLTLNRSAAMDDLPELPFRKILSYLSLEDRIRSRAVARRWRTTIDLQKVTSLFYRSDPEEFDREESCVMSGVSAWNFISSSSFEFFNTFAKSILSNLKHLHLHEIRFDARVTKIFSLTLNSFSWLEELTIAGPRIPWTPPVIFELNLPMLNAIQIRSVNGIKELTLNAPRLLDVTFFDSALSLNFVHRNSVEKLTTNCEDNVNFWGLENLKHLYLENPMGEDRMRQISNLRQLKELHLVGCRFYSTSRGNYIYIHPGLKIYLRGMLLDDPIDSNVLISNYFFGYLAKNESRLAGEIPFERFLSYSAIEAVSPELAINILNRFTDLIEIHVDSAVQDIERFLGVLKNFNNIVALEFKFPQRKCLFDRLPDYCNVQKLTINNPPPDLDFLLRLKDLKVLRINLLNGGQPVVISMVSRKRFRVVVKHGISKFARDLKAAIQNIIEMYEV